MERRLAKHHGCSTRKLPHDRFAFASTAPLAAKKARWEARSETLHRETFRPIFGRRPGPSLAVGHMWVMRYTIAPDIERWELQV
jgi:hypothetical protein